MHQPIHRRQSLSQQSQKVGRAVLSAPSATDGRRELPAPVQHRGALRTARPTSHETAHARRAPAPAVDGTNPFRLEGETALITGGGTGIGLAIARSLVAAGARVVLASRRTELLEAAAEEIGPQAEVVSCDVTRFSEAPRFIAKAEKPFGPISILINNAGIHLKKPACETTEEEFQAVLNTHVLGAHALTRALLPGMIERRHGSVVFILSMASLFGLPNVLAYSAAKSACLGMVRALATEVSPLGVRVNGIAPGWITTEMTHKAMEGDPARKRRILARTPLGRFGNPEDIGGAAVYLCSPAAKFVTGAVLPVDGGVSIGF